ncbi:MAG: 30S ribosomal protein S27e [archaeon]|nr:30S ribosomal protein S27e [archaeon]
MTKNELIPKPKSRFLKIVCLNCGSTQNVFGCASMEVKCHTCQKVIVQPTGGKARILTKISDVLT